MFRWRPKPNRMSTGKNTVKQSLVWCTPMKTHLPKCSPWGISSEYSLAHSPMMGLHCCVLTHHLVKDKAFNLSGVQCLDFLGDLKEGDGLCLGHLQSVSVETGSHREPDSHLWQQEDLGWAFSRTALGESWHGEHHTQQHARYCGLRNWVDGSAHAWNRECWPGATSRSAGLMGHLSADATYVLACGGSGVQLRCLRSIWWWEKTSAHRGYRWKEVRWVKALGGDVVIQGSCIQWKSTGQKLETRGKWNQDLGGDQSKWTDKET